MPQALDSTYVFDVYGLLVSGASHQDTVPYLYSVEGPGMGRCAASTCLHELALHELAAKPAAYVAGGR